MTPSVMATERRERLHQIIEQLTDAELEGFLAGLRGMRRGREALHGTLEAGQGEGHTHGAHEEASR
jgi:hypothetical protein